jgi:hypothetical protein
LTAALCWRTVRPATLGDTVKADLKNRLSELVSAGCPTHRLARLARLEIETAWNDLSAAEVAELDAWLENQQMSTQVQLEVNWAYVRAALTSVRQTRGAEGP